MSVNYEISDIFNYSYTGPVSTTVTGVASALPEISTADFTGTQAVSANGGYFMVNGANNSTLYYVYNDLVGDQSGDPLLSGHTAIPVDTSALTHDTDGGYATEARIQINAVAAGVLTATGPVAEVSTVNTTSVFSALNVAGASTYFRIRAANDEFSYYVWFAKGAATDPAPGGTGIQAFGAATDDPTLATEIAAALAAVNGGTDFNASAVANLVTITNDNGGTTTNIVNGASPVVNLVVATTVQGNDTITITTVATGNTTDITNATTLPWASLLVAVTQQGTGAANANSGLMYRDAANNNEVRILGAGTLGQVLTVTSANVLGWQASGEASTDTTFCVEPGVAQTIPTGALGTFTTLAFVVIADPGSNFSTPTYTAPTAGVYIFHFDVEWSTAAKSNKGSRQVNLRAVSAAANLLTLTEEVNSNKLIAYWQRGSIMRTAASGATFILQVAHNSGSNETIGVGTKWMGSRISF
jgi:hypothetical protein